MKKFIIPILSVIIGFFGITFADLEFTNYQVLGQIQNDGTINVQENIDVHFFDDMHGIQRIFEQTYVVDDTKFKNIVENIDVPGYNYKIIDNYDDKTIRIGDADKYVIGNKKYEINYSIYGLIKNFSGMGYAELYRDIIGYTRNNDIKNVQIELTLPKAYTGLTKDDFLISAGYTNKYSIDDFDGDIKRDENKIYITYNKRLESYEGITLAIKFPKDYFEFNHEKQENLFVGYTHDFNVSSYTLHGTIEEDGNIKFQNKIELKVLNTGFDIRGKLPFKYYTNGKYYLTQLNDIEINGVEKKISKYDTTNAYSTFTIPGNFTQSNTISGNYSIYGLVRPFSGEFEDRAYRLYIPLPTLYLSEGINNFELSLDVPGGCSTLYEEDISVQIHGTEIGFNEYTENYGDIRCRDDKFMMNYYGKIYNDNLGLYINFVKGTFNLDEDLLEALATIGDGQLYYTDKTNRQSIVFAIGIILFGLGFKVLMNKRYNKKSRKGEKYPIQYDTPKGVDAPEAGILVDNTIDPKDITSLIYQRAANHYIKILRENDNEKEFFIKKLKQLPGNSKKYQIYLFNSLFKEDDDFHFAKKRKELDKYLSTTQKELRSHIISERRYKTTFYSGIGSSFKSENAILIIATAILGFIPYFGVLTAINQFLVPVSNWVKTICFISFLLIITSYRNYKEETNTKKGQEVRNHCLGYKDFLIKVDEKKLETLLKTDPLYVEKALPFAIVFKIDSEFIKKITPKMIEDLDWFDGDLDELSKSINYIQKYSTTSFYTSTSSSSGHSSSYSSSGGFSSGSSFGGGFSSGGGGGGGGGGGW